MNTFIPIILLSFIFSGQVFAQWEKTNFPTTVQVNTLAISGLNIFAGTDGDGIFVSTDNGKNWESSNEGLQGKVIHKIFIDSITLPAGQARIYAGTETGVSISTNNGKSWNTSNSGLSVLGVWSFEKSNSGDSTILAGTSDGIYFSTDNGKNWKATGLPHTSMPVHSIVAHNNYVFAATLAAGVFYSRSNGFGWNDISIIESDINTGISTLVPAYSIAIIDTNVIAGAGSRYIYYSSIVNPIFDREHRVSNGNMPILCFTMHDAKLFAGNSTGNIFLSDSNGLAWKSLTPSLTNQAIYSLVLNNSYIFAGTGNGVWRLQYPETTTNVENLIEVPAGFALEQNYPNPFNPVTTIKYSIPRQSVGNETHLAGRQDFHSVQLIVYDVLGRVVAILVNEEKHAGSYEVTWNAADLPSGMYFYQLIVSNSELGSGKVYSATKKLMYLK